MSFLCARLKPQVAAVLAVVVIGILFPSETTWAEEPLPKGHYAITGVKVKAVDRTKVDGKTFDHESDKLTYWIRFDVRTKAERLSGTEKLSYEVLNPIDHSKTSLTFDKAIKFGGKEVPAGTNLLKYQNFDGARYNVSMPKLSPLAIKSVRIQSGFEIPPDTYTVNFQWSTMKGKIFSSKVKVHIDVNLKGK